MAKDSTGQETSWPQDTGCIGCTMTMTTPNIYKLTLDLTLKMCTCSKIDVSKLLARHQPTDSDTWWLFATLPVFVAVTTGGWALTCCQPVASQRRGNRPCRAMSPDSEPMTQHVTRLVNGDILFACSNNNFKQALKRKVECI